MNNRFRILFLVIAAFVSMSGMIAWFLLRQDNDPPEALNEIRALARAGRFDQAQPRLERFLQVSPGNGQAHLLMAQFALDRAEPSPAIALEHLKLIRPENRVKAALIKFFMGKAHYLESRYDLAETCWTEALRLDPTVPEAGWALLDLFELEGRIEEAHLLGLRLHETEPDRRDQVRFLLKLAQLDIDRSSPASLVNIFEPMVRKVPQDLNLSVTLGLALIHDSKAATGVKVLRETVRSHPESPEAWNALLTGLDDAGRPDELAAEFANLPKAIAADPRFAKHEGLVAQARLEWKKASDAYRRAIEYQPSNSVILYRLSRVLRLSGETVQTERVDQRLSNYQTAYKELRAVVDEAFAIKTLGLVPMPDLYQRLADLRERMGRSDDARAWHRLVLRDNPNQKLSLVALERLK